MNFCAVSQPQLNSQWNKDTHGHIRDDYFWVIDGATIPSALVDGLANSPIVEFVSVLSDQIEKALPLTKSLQAAIDQACQSCPEHLSNDWKKWQRRSAYRPCATLAIAGFTETEVRGVVLGDCSVIIERKDGSIEVITDNRLSWVATRERAELRSLRESGINESDKRYRAAHLKLVSAEQAALNRAKGYWATEAGASPGKMALPFSCSRADVSSLLLCTDGFANAVEKYKIYASWSELLRDAEQIGLEKITEKIRKFEKVGDSCNVKKSDDATAVLIRP